MLTEKMTPDEKGAKMRSMIDQALDGVVHVQASSLFGVKDDGTKLVKIVLTSGRGDSSITILSLAAARGLRDQLNDSLAAAKCV